MIVRIYPDQDLYLWANNKNTQSLVFRLNVDIAKSSECKRIIVHVFCLNLYEIQMLYFYSSKSKKKDPVASTYVYDNYPKYFDRRPFIQELADFCNMRVNSLGFVSDTLFEYCGIYELVR